jgi:CDP-glucose 4,6-dehydratase
VTLSGLPRLRQLPGPILITGHTGFKGTWTTLLLDFLNIPVVGYSLEPTQDSLFNKVKPSNLQVSRFADVRDRSSLTKIFNEVKPSAVIHLAAQPLVIESYRTPLETFETNVIGTANVLSAARDTHSILGLIAVTTDKVYENLNMGRRFIESDALRGKDPYSASKVAAEATVAAWQQIAEIKGGQKITAVRAGNVIGGGDMADNRLIPDVVRGIKNNRKVDIRNPQSTRPWQHVLDPLLGYLMTLEFQLTGGSVEALNFGPAEESLSVASVIQIIKKEWPDCVEFDYSQSETNIPTLESKTLDLNSQKAETTLGWAPNWSQESAIRSSINWWKDVLLENVSESEACLRDIQTIKNF